MLAVSPMLKYTSGDKQAGQKRKKEPVNRSAPDILNKDQQQNNQNKNL